MTSGGIDLDGAVGTLEGKRSGAIYAQIFARIVAGEFPIDARLPAETELARRFGASRRWCARRSPGCAKTVLSFLGKVPEAT